MTRDPRAGAPAGSTVATADPDRAPPPPPDRAPQPPVTSDAGRRRAWTAAHVTTLAVAAAVLLRANRNQWFFKDEWVFFARSIGNPPLDSIWAAHNGHWSTIPILIYRALFAVFHLTSYWPYVAVLLALHLLAVHLGWRLCRHAGAGPATATAVAAVLAVLGSGAENLLWAFQIGFVGSVAVVLAAALVLDRARPGPARLVAGAALAVLSLPFSGMSVPLMVLPALVCLLRAGLLRTVGVFLAPVAVYLVWLVVAPPDVTGSVFARPTPGQWARYVVEGVRDAVGGATGLGRYAGPAMVVLGAVLALVVTVRARRSAPTGATGRYGFNAGAPAVVAGSTLAALAVYAVVAVGRGTLGITQAGEGRYIYVASMAGGPAAAGIAAALLRWGRPRGGLIPATLPLAGLAVFALISNAEALQSRVALETGRETVTRESVAAAVALVRAGEPVFQTPADPLSGSTTPAAMARFARAGDFGNQLGTPPPSVLDAVRLRLQLSLTAGSPQPGDRPLSILPAPGTVSRPDGACRSFAPESGIGPAQLLISAATGPGSATVRPPHSGTMTAEYLPAPGDVLASATMTRNVYLGHPTTVRWLSRAGTVRLTSTRPGPTVVCAPGRTPAG